MTQEKKYEQDVSLVKTLGNQKFISEKDIKTINDSMDFMFIGQCWVNWSRGAILEKAVLDAVKQMNSFVNTKKSDLNNNPVIEMLSELAVSKQRAMSIMVMLNKHSDKKMKSSEKTELEGLQIVRNAKDNLNKLIEKYQENEKTDNWNIAKNRIQSFFQQKKQLQRI